MKIRTNKNLEKRIENFMNGLGEYGGWRNIGIEEYTTTKDYKTYKTVGYELKEYSPDHWTSDPDIILEFVAECIDNIHFFKDGEFISWKEAKKILISEVEKRLKNIDNK